ncbi:MAG: (5-formylfuran-3-yl)methyl phosphate synthase [Planctomycetaceae bacterium]
MQSNAFPAESSVDAASSNPPGLLISVRSLAEAAAVADMPISVLDLKEPQQGPLAPASRELWKAVGDRFSQRLQLSAALGECDQAVDLAADVPASFTYAKAGPADCGTLERLARAWNSLTDRLPEQVELVAVAYADHAAASCPDPLTILTQAADMGLKTWLIDTFVKDGRSALDHLAVDQWKAIDKLAKSHSAKWVMAGSLRLQHLRAFDRSRPAPERLPLPNLFGVRGDVCQGPRSSQICPSSVARWLRAIPQLGRE